MLPVPFRLPTRTSCYVFISIIRTCSAAVLYFQVRLMGIVVTVVVVVVVAVVVVVVVVVAAAEAAV